MGLQTEEGVMPFRVELVSKVCTERVANPACAAKKSRGPVGPSWPTLLPLAVDRSVLHRAAHLPQLPVPSLVPHPRILRWLRGARPSAYRAGAQPQYAFP